MVLTNPQPLTAVPYTALQRLALELKGFFHIIQGTLQIQFDVETIDVGVLFDQFIGPLHVKVSLADRSSGEFEAVGFDDDFIVPEMIGEGAGRQIFDGGYGIFSDVQPIDGVDAGSDKWVIDLIQDPDDFFREGIGVVLYGQFDA